MKITFTDINGNELLVDTKYISEIYENSVLERKNNKFEVIPSNDGYTVIKYHNSYLRVKNTKEEIESL